MKHPYVRHIFLDASALVALVLDSWIPQPGASEINAFWTTWSNLSYTNEPSLTEAFTVLKREWKRGPLSLDDYKCAVGMLHSMTIGDGFRISTFDYWQPKHCDLALQIVAKHSVDFLDAIQIVDIKQGPYYDWVSESATVLVTSDHNLAMAARSEGITSWCAHCEPPPQ